MAVLHLQFDVDSEVHPELHATLTSIGSPLSQAERLRQLAATGLIWERLRLHAYGPMEVPDVGTESAAAREGSGSWLQRPTAASVPAVPAVPRGEATTAGHAELTGFVDLGDTVDLAHLDVPGPHDADDGRSGHGAAQITAALLQPGGDMPEPLPLHEIRSVVQELPVLNDVIGAVELPGTGAVVGLANEALAGAEHADRGGTMPGVAQIHELAPSRQTATRSRLMRMKEKGLFKNE